MNEEVNDDVNKEIKKEINEEGKDRLNFVLHGCKCNKILWTYL